MAKILDIEDTLRQIVKDEDAKGRLKEDYFTDEVKSVSHRLRDLRANYRNHKSIELKQKVLAESESLADLKAKEVEVVIARVKKRVDISINDECEVNGKTVYRCNNLDTLLVSKYIMRDLVENYHITTGDRNAIVEELYVLLNNNTPKMVIRSDISSFFESIPHEPLLKYLEEDSRISTYSLKYLRLFLGRYNALLSKDDPKAVVGVGLPRGLCFSSVLSEIYLTALDIQLKHNSGILFYKRYVDDIIMLAPSYFEGEKIIASIREALLSIDLRMNEEKSAAIKISDDMAETATFTYLGYKFVVGSNGAELHLSERKCNKYKYLVDQIFAKYDRSSHYRSRKSSNGRKKMDALVVLKRELDVLTGNGSLNRKKHFIKTGVYYSNKLLTNLEELDELDRYLETKICELTPARNLFQYNGEDQYEARVDNWKRVLRKYSFMDGFEKKRMCVFEAYTEVLTTLKKIYNNWNNE